MLRHRPNLLHIFDERVNNNPKYYVIIYFKQMVDRFQIAILNSVLVTYVN